MVKSRKTKNQTNLAKFKKSNIENLAIFKKPDFTKANFFDIVFFTPKAELAFS